MRKGTIKKRLERMAPNRATIAYKLINNWLNVEGNMVIRPCWTSGRGRFTTNLDYTEDLIRLLNDLRVRHIVGNDAPKGGKCGNFVVIILDNKKPYHLIINHMSEFYGSKKEAKKRLIDAFLNGENISHKSWEL